MKCEFSIGCTLWHAQIICLIHACNRYSHSVHCAECRLAHKAIRVSFHIENAQFDKHTHKFETRFLIFNATCIFQPNTYDASHFRNETYQGEMHFFSSKSSRLNNQHGFECTFGTPADNVRIMLAEYSDRTSYNRALFNKSRQIVFFLDGDVLNSARLYSV